MLAGVISGAALSIAQWFAVIPLIVEAERYEVQAEDSPAVDSDGPAGVTPPWAPADGLERTAYTVAANVLTGIGFGLLLCGCFALHGGTVNGRRGLPWGAAGFAAFALAPALGLPPELPGAAAAALESRQIWWLATAASTAGGLALMAFARPWWLRGLGVVLLLLPHVAGAPQLPSDVEDGPPAALARQFIAASLATSALFWLMLGGLAGALYRRLGLR